jgi:ribosomal protein S18 acetylase RimI-like enzyme
MALSIRSATTDDISAVLAFWQVAAAGPSATDDDAGMRALLRAQPDGLLLAEDRGTIVGTLIAVWDGWRGAMYRLAVAPERRRGGIGRRLVEEGERRLRAAGARRINALVLRENRVAQRSWDSYGYSRDTGDDRWLKMLEP